VPAANHRLKSIPSVAERVDVRSRDGVDSWRARSVGWVGGGADLEGARVEDLEERKPESELVLEAVNGEGDFWEGDGGTVRGGSEGKGSRGDAVMHGRSRWVAGGCESEKDRERSRVPIIVLQVGCEDERSGSEGASDSISRWSELRSERERNKRSAGTQHSFRQS